MSKDKAIHIATVGTSVVANFRREHPDREAELDALVRYVAQDPVKASAELAAMSVYLDQRDVGGVYLVHTDGPDSRLAAHAIRTYLVERRSVQADLKEIPGFSDEGGHEAFLSGLVELLERTGLFALRKTRSGKRVMFNATGGYKPAVAVLTYVGCALGWPVYYRHETFPKTVTLPRLPPAPRPEMMSLIEELAARPEQHMVDPPPGSWAASWGEILDEALDQRYIVAEKDLGTRPHRYMLGPAGKILWAVYRREQKP